MLLAQGKMPCEYFSGVPVDNLCLEDVTVDGKYARHRFKASYAAQPRAATLALCHSTSRKEGLFLEVED